MAQILKKLSTWLIGSKIKTYEFWGRKRTRTSILVLNAIDFPEDPTGSFIIAKEVTIYHSTWRFEIINTGETEARVFFNDGTFFLFTQDVRRLDFPGQPYVERDDIFPRIEFDDEQAQLTIVMHRIVEPVM